jgi:hypothetical protein
MNPPRFSQLSLPRQDLVRRCQRIGFGRINGLVVADAEPAFAATTVILVDVKLDGEEYRRPEQDLPDFALAHEVVRLFSMLDEIGSGIIEHIEVRAGLPRRLIVRAQA